MKQERSPARKRARRRPHNSLSVSRELMSDPIATPVFRSQLQRTPSPSVPNYPPEQQTTNRNRSTPFVDSFRSRRWSLRRRSSIGIPSTPDLRLLSPNQNTLRTPTPRTSRAYPSTRNFEVQVSPTPTPAPIGCGNWHSPTSTPHSPGLLSAQAPLLPISLTNSTSSSRSNPSLLSVQAHPVIEQGRPNSKPPPRRLSFGAPFSPRLAVSPSPTPLAGPVQISLPSPVAPSPARPANSVRISHPSFHDGLSPKCPNHPNDGEDKIDCSNKILDNNYQELAEADAITKDNPRKEPLTILTRFLPHDSDTPQTKSPQHRPGISEEKLAHTSVLFVRSLTGGVISTPAATSTLAERVKLGQAVHDNAGESKWSPTTGSGRVHRKKRSRVSIDVLQQNSNPQPKSGTRRVVPIRIEAPEDDVESDTGSSSTVPPSPPLLLPRTTVDQTPTTGRRVDEISMFCRPMSVSIPAGALRSPNISEESEDERT